MEQRFQTRLDELRRDAHVPDGLLRGLEPRLHAFLRPFAAWFLTQETRRGKKADPGPDRAAGPAGHRPGAAPAGRVRPPDPGAADDGAMAPSYRGRPILPLEETEPLANQTFRA